MGVWKSRMVAFGLKISQKQFKLPMHPEKNAAKKFSASLDRTSKKMMRFVT